MTSSNDEILSYNQNSIRNSGYSDQFFLGSGDNPDQQLGTYKLN